MRDTELDVSDRILLCTDLDRTLIPNGSEPESPAARPLVAALAARAEITLAFVTGRRRELVEDAIEEYDLPRPRIVVGDVGSTIYELTNAEWHVWSDWQAELGRDWGPGDREAIAAVLETHDQLSLQDPSSQSRFKISYHAPATSGRWLEELRDALERGPATRVVWSRDETQNEGLLDLLPKRGGKLGAIRFLCRKLGVPADRTVFAGDSGNDLEVLTSEIPSVLVANAADEIKRRAEALAAESDRADTLYIARGGFRGMNGNYGAGILEGLAHHLPETAAWMP